MILNKHVNAVATYIDDHHQFCELIFNTCFMLTSITQIIKKTSLNIFPNGDRLGFELSKIRCSGTLVNTGLASLIKFWLGKARLEKNPRYGENVALYVWDIATTERLKHLQNRPYTGLFRCYYPYRE
jgi:hypothetical protein